MKCVHVISKKSLVTVDITPYLPILMGALQHIYARCLHAFKKSEMKKISSRLRVLFIDFARNFEALDLPRCLTGQTT